MSSKSKTFALILTLTIAMSCLTSLVVIPAQAQFASIQHLPEITINKDGSITPQTPYLNRTGNIYTLTADIESKYSVRIDCSNVIFDGMEHSINTTVDGLQYVDGQPASYADPSIYVRDSTNVTIQNVLAFTSNVYAIYLLDCSNCYLIGITTDKSDCISIKGNSNTITKCNAGVCVFDGSNNRIIRNNISNIFLASACQIYKNNFFLTDKPDLTVSSLWDNGSIGNYWSNYTVKYPNASEIDHSGIGNTPYSIERADYSTREYSNATNIDNYPLMYPYDTEHDSINVPTNTSTATSPDISAIDANMTGVIVGTFIITVIVALFLLLYSRHGKNR
jgi:hypothetical protein